MIKIDYFKKETFDKIESFLADYINDLDSYKKNNFDRLKKKILSKPDGFIVAEEDKNILGLIHVEKQVWDSNHFGLNFAKINFIIAQGNYSEKYNIIKGLLEKVDELKYDYVILRWDVQDLPVIHSLEAVGYRFIVDSITLVHNLRNMNKLNNLIDVRTCKEEDIPALMDLAKSTFIFDRFHTDPELDNKKCDSLHSEWIKNCCNHRLADEVFVVEIGNKIVGFSACKIDKDNKLGTVVLLGISSDFKNKGLGTILLYATLNFLKSNNVELVEIRPELSNIPAVNLYQNLGFKIILTEGHYRKFKK